MIIFKHQPPRRHQRLFRGASLALSLIVFTLLIRVAPARAATNPIIDGSWSCKNLGGDIRPIVGATVEIWEQESSTASPLDKRIGTTYTDSSGRYFFEVIASLSPHIYRAVLIYNDNQVRLEGSQDLGTTVTGNSASGNIHHDVVISRDDGKGTPACAIWQGAQAAYQEYVRTVGQQPPARVYTIQMSNNFPNIQLSNIFPPSITFGTPFTILDTTYWPYNFPTTYGNGHGPYVPYDNNFHEFGHSVRHSLDGDFNHFLSDVARFAYMRNHYPCGPIPRLSNEIDKGFAFNEGWAEFWAIDWGATPPNAPHCSGVSTTDMTVEGNVAAALYNLSLCPGVGRAGMVKVLQQNPGKIHSFAEFRDALTRIFPTCKLGVIK